MQLNSAYIDVAPHLVRSPDGQLELFFQSNRGAGQIAARKIYRSLCVEEMIGNSGL